MNTLLCLTLAAVCCTSLVFGQSTCSTDSDCSAIKGSSCQIRAPCKKGYCVCPPRQWASGGTCVDLPAPKSKTNLDAACSTDADCGINTKCSSSKCACEDNYTPTGDNVNCGAYSNGATCSGSNICGNTGNSDCSTGNCACKSGFTWATGGDINQPGGCVDTKATVNVAQGQTCSGRAAWLTDAGNTLKYCGTNLYCQQCPEGGSLSCLSGSTSLTVAVATLVMAAVCGLLLGRL